MDRELILDSAERVGVTAVLAGLGVAVTEMQGWPVGWGVAVAALLNIIKVAVASRFGDPDTGGLVDTRTGSPATGDPGQWLSPTGDEWAASLPTSRYTPTQEVED